MYYLLWKVGAIFQPIERGLIRTETSLTRLSYMLAPLPFFEGVCACVRAWTRACIF